MQVGDLYAFLGDLRAVSLHPQSTLDAFKVILHPRMLAVRTNIETRALPLPCGMRTHPTRGAATSQALFKGVSVREPVSLHHTL